LLFYISGGVCYSHISICSISSVINQRSDITRCCRGAKMVPHTQVGKVSHIWGIFRYTLSRFDP